MFTNKVVLISGGTGSFGIEMLKFLVKTKVKEIRILSRDEKKQEDLRRSIKDNRVNYIIGDVRDYSSVLSSTRKVDFVFQAAALKQVPTCEFFPLEAYKTNVLGTSNIIDASIENKNNDKDVESDNVDLEEKDQKVKNEKKNETSDSESEK